MPPFHQKGAGMTQRMGDRLVVFLREPVPGRVKTRLARAIGEQAACEAYCELVGRVVENLAELSGVELRFTPDGEGSGVVRWRRPDWAMAPQGEGDLGERMLRAFQEKFEEGADRVLIVGSDCPFVTVSDVVAGWAALVEHDVVLGPAVDGGYWCIGLRGVWAEVFCGVGWGGADVLRATMARASEAGLSVALLRELPDVDTVEDWQRFRRGVLL